MKVEITTEEKIQALKVKRHLSVGDVLQSAARKKKEESFLEYKERLRMENDVLKDYLKGKVVKKGGEK
tara:strand:- start:3188 stop:3391 length:204 start_codon:yes stop_codon:yes gene_type:complete